MRKRRMRRRRRTTNRETAVDISNAAHTPDFMPAETESTIKMPDNNFITEDQAEPNDSLQQQTISNNIAEEKKSRPKQPGSIIQLHIMAEDETPYSGYELLQTLLSVGLRFGERQIFHNYINQDPNLGTWFSVASVTKPGTFELGSIGAFSCPGLVFFIADGVTVYNATSLRKMLSVAEVVVDELGGQIWGAERKPLSMADVEALFQRFPDQEVHYDTETEAGS